MKHYPYIYIGKSTLRFGRRLTRGGGGALDFHVDGGGGGVPLGVEKPDPVAMRSVHKIYTLSQYTLL